MSEEVKEKEVDVHAFVQRKLQILNTKSGARYERDAARVVQNNMIFQDNSHEEEEVHNGKM